MIPDDSYPIDSECTITVKGGEIKYISLCYGKPEQKAALAVKHIDSAIRRLEIKVRWLAMLRELRGLIERGLAS